MLPPSRGSITAAPDPPVRGTVAATVVIPTLNEQERIADAVSDAAVWADEIIVVDGGSEDDTVFRAQTAGAKVHVLRGSSIGQQRNLGASMATNEWVFALDTDERVSESLREELRAVLSAPANDAYRVRMQNFYLGRERKRGRWGRDWHVRLYKRDLRFGLSRVHERLQAVGSTGTLRGRVIHNPYQDLSHHLTKMIKYARWGALELHARGRRATAVDLAVRPAWRFVRDYLFYGSFLDGRYGLTTSTLTAYTAFLKYAFLYELGNSDVPQGGPDSSRNAASGQSRSTRGI
ncbi:MAG: glycosyltransferase family 2 protein [Gemmatimonadota bacterium]|nr:glycosyltransferase family 2 protein [Gemmatimonadota bacterium]